MTFTLMPPGKGEKQKLPVGGALGLSPTAAVLTVLPL